MKPFYQDKYVTIFNADCRDILPSLEPVDLVLTDPPYGIDIAKTGKVGGENKAQVKQYIASDWDKDRLSIDVINLIRSKSVNQIIFGGNYIADLLPASPCWIVWDKDNTGNFADCELAWTSFKTATRKYLWRWNGMLQEAGNPKEVRHHPTQKPEGLFSAIIAGYSKDTDLILDPFFGSGTTGYCSKKLQRRCIGIEIEEKYCEVAARRCQQEVMELVIPTQYTDKQQELL